MMRRSALEWYWQAQASWATEDARAATDYLRKAQKWCEETLAQSQVTDPDVLFDGIELGLLLSKVNEALAFAERNRAGSHPSGDVRRAALKIAKISNDPTRIRWWGKASNRAVEPPGEEMPVGVSEILITESEIYRRVSDAHLEFLDAISQSCLDRGIRLRPVHQSFLGMPNFGRGQPRLSYHTQGANPSVLHWKEGHLPGFFSLDARGYAGWATAADDTYPTVGRAAGGPSRRSELFDRFSFAGLSKYHQAPAPYNGAGGFILVPLQIERDTVESLAFRSPLDFYRDVVRIARAAGYRVVLKAHPLSNSERYRAFLDDVTKGDEGVVESQAPINELIAHSLAVFTINSGVGFEALLHGKPVVVGGGCDYRWASIAAHDAKGVASALARLQEEDSDGLMDRIEAFVSHYYERYVFDVPRRHNMDRAADMVSRLLRVPAIGGCR